MQLFCCIYNAAFLLHVKAKKNGAEKAP